MTSKAHAGKQPAQDKKHSTPPNVKHSDRSRGRTGSTDGSHEKKRAQGKSKAPLAAEGALTTFRDQSTVREEEKLREDIEKKIGQGAFEVPEAGSVSLKRVWDNDRSATHTDTKKKVTRATSEPVVRDPVSKSSRSGNRPTVSTMTERKKHTDRTEVTEGFVKSLNDDRVALFYENWTKLKSGHKNVLGDCRMHCHTSGVEGLKFEAKVLKQSLIKPRLLTSNPPPREQVEPPMGKITSNIGPTEESGAIAVSYGTSASKAILKLAEEIQYWLGQNHVNIPDDYFKTKHT